MWNIQIWWKGVNKFLMKGLTWTSFSVDSMMVMLVRTATASAASQLLLLLRLSFILASCHGKLSTHILLLVAEQLLSEIEYVYDCYLHTVGSSYQWVSDSSISSCAIRTHKSLIERNRQQTCLHGYNISNAGWLTVWIHTNSRISSPSR